MGVVCMDLGMDEEAVKYLERAVEILPYDYQSRNNLGIVYGRSGEPEKALREFAVAIQLKPDDDTIKINLSVFYHGQKEYENAERVLKAFDRQEPQGCQSLFSARPCLQRDGEKGGCRLRVSEGTGLGSSRHQYL